MHDDKVDKVVQQDCADGTADKLQASGAASQAEALARHLRAPVLDDEGFYDFETFSPSRARRGGQMTKSDIVDGRTLSQQPAQVQSKIESDERADQRTLTRGEIAGKGPRDAEAQRVTSGNFIHCVHCGKDDVAESMYQIGMCVDCYVEYSNRNTRVAKFGNRNWKEDAKQAGVELYEQQPAESLMDYQKFCMYRDMYPATRPTLKAVAKQAGVSYGTVASIASRWHWSERLEEWIKACDRQTLIQRRQEMIDMNKRHIELSELAGQKVRAALEALDPAFMKPSEINQLMKTMAQLERESRTDTIAQEELRTEVTHGMENPELKQSPTSSDDFAEILSVLKQAGVLDGSNIGIKKTNKEGTTELVVKTDKEVNSNAQ